jgi:hypothetical protein
MVGLKAAGAIAVLAMMLGIIDVPGQGFDQVVVYAEPKLGRVMEAVAANGCMAPVGLAVGPVAPKFGEKRRLIDPRTGQPVVNV